MNTHDKYELPPLPEPMMVDSEPYWFDSHMRAYACTAIEPYAKRIAELESQLEAIGAGGVTQGQRLIEADRQRRGEPSGYAYRYRHYDGGTVIRFNDGCEVNGSRPIEALPYWFTPQPAEPCVSSVSDKTACGSANGDGDSQPAEPVKVPSYCTHTKCLIASGCRGPCRYGQPAQPAAPARHPDVHDNNSVLVGFADDAQPAVSAELPATEQEQEAWQRMERRS